MLKAIKFSKKTLIAIFISLSFLALGYASGRIYKTYEINMLNHNSEMDHSKMGTEHKENMNHDEKELVGPNRYAPTITKLQMEKDSMSGYNLNIQTSNFYFTPNNAGDEAVQNTGHIHLYVNNVKVGRVYSNWYHIPENFFQNGTNTVSVTLNANNHNVWWSKNGTKEARENLIIIK